MKGRSTVMYVPILRNAAREMQATESAPRLYVWQKNLLGSAFATRSLSAAD
jgi:hypothetical protein